MIGYLIGLVFIGLIAGALGRLIVPGPNPMGIGATILVGIGGAFAAGIIGRLIFGRGYAAGWILSSLCAAVIVYFIQRGGRRREV